MSAKLILVFAIFALASAATNDDGPMYQINEARYKELLVRMKDAGITDAKTTFLNSVIQTFSFTCAQVIELINCYTGEENKVLGLEILRENIVDANNKQTIIDKFSFAESKKKVIDLLANIVSSKTQGIAPEKLPKIELPYTSQWGETEFHLMVNELKSISMTAKKVDAAIKAIMGKSNGVSSSQAVYLFKQVPFSGEMLRLAEAIKDRLMGVTCEEIKEILGVFSMSGDKIEALKAFKEAITDVENKFSILDAWSMSSDKEKARKILEDLKPRSFIFGNPRGKVAFLLDYSGSMSISFVLSTGQKISRLGFVKNEFAKVAQNFDEKTQFDVFAYAERVVAWKPTLQVATKAIIPQAITFVNQFPASGRTNIYDALKMAWNTPDVETIYLLTDGTPSCGGKTAPAAILADVQAWNAKTKITVHTIAFLMGPEPDTSKANARAFMKSLAEATSGTFRSIESEA